MSISTTFSQDTSGYEAWEITGHWDAKDIREGITTLLGMLTRTESRELTRLRVDLERANERCTNYAKRLDTARNYLDGKVQP